MTCPVPRYSTAKARCDKIANREPGLGAAERTIAKLREVLEDERRRSRRFLSEVCDATGQDLCEEGAAVKRIKALRVQADTAARFEKAHRELCEQISNEES